MDERKSEWELARRALAWLIVALEPLRLSQIVEGLSAELLQRDLKKDNDEIRSLLLDGLSSLVSYCSETDGIVLSHCSVKVHFCIFLHYTTCLICSTGIPHLPDNLAHVPHRLP